MEPTWRELAKRLKKTEIYVGKIDIGKARSVTSRLGIKGIPTILLFRDGRTRIYNSNERSLENFTDFAFKGWRDVTPLPLYKDPLTIPGKVYGLIHRCVSRSSVFIHSSRPAYFLWRTVPPPVCALSVPSSSVILYLTSHTRTCFFVCIFVCVLRRYNSGGLDLRFQFCMQNYVHSCVKDWQINPFTVRRTIQTRNRF